MRSLALAMACLPLCLHASITPLVNLLEAGTITLQPVGLGGHSGDCLRVDVHNRSSAPISTSIPAGWLFPSVQDGVQDLIIAREEVITLAPHGRRSITCRAFCCEASNRSPMADERYRQGRPAPPALIALAQAVDSGRYADDIVQNAVWVLSDSNDIGSTGALDGSADDKLRERLSTLSGQPAPRYTLRYAEEEGRACSKRPASISRAFHMALGTPQRLHVRVLRDDGRLVTAVHNGTLLPTGDHDIPIDLDVREWPAGRYAIHVYTDEGTGVRRMPFTL